MSDSLDSAPRSLELMSADDSLLLVVDVQEKLIRLIPGYERIVWNIGRLVDGAKILSLPVLGSEQYPQGLGPTTPALAEKLGPLPGKIAFSCGGCGEVMSALQQSGRTKVLIVGIEAHVCVLQTALDLLASGYRVYLAVDAIGARHEVDYQTALRRLEACGASLVTTEMALFEWCRVAGTPQFKQISALVRELPSKPEA
jgi:nicotinamidase-related amidase